MFDGQLQLTPERPRGRIFATSHVRALSGVGIPMIASARFTLTRAYFEESFENWLRSRSRLRRWQLQLGTVAAVGAIICFLLGGRLVILGGLLALVSAVEICEFIWYRRKWITDRVAARSSSAGEVLMEFDDVGIYSKGPTSEGRISWAGVKGVSESKNGLSFALGDGMSIYVPKASVDPANSVGRIVELAGGRT